jgi:hypothetical protein
MITITLNITNLNNSLQVGDVVYAVGTTQQHWTSDLEDDLTTLGAITETPVSINQVVGVLRRIVNNANGLPVLDIDETVFIGSTPPNPGDFLMFSKWNQTDGDVVGYYAQANFINDSKEKAELFSIGSEIIISSK